VYTNARTVNLRIRRAQGLIDMTASASAVLGYNLMLKGHFNVLASNNTR
jgi:hypothetical protein